MEQIKRTKEQESDYRRCADFIYQMICKYGPGLEAQQKLSDNRENEKEAG